MKKAISVIDNPDVAKILADPMRRLMLNILADNMCTEMQLARRLGVSDPLVAHHMKMLKIAGVVSVAKTEAESHGILQKFYEPTAMCYIVDYDKLQPDLKRYFFAVYLERLRGILCALRYMGEFSQEVSSETIEQLAETMARAIVPVARKMSDMPLKNSREEIIVELFSKTLAVINLLGSPVSGMRYRRGVKE